MEIETNYAVKLFFSNPSFTQIYFEAVANAFDAEASEVVISISTDGDISPKQLDVNISDNGAGFTDDRFDRFRKLKEPKDAYHKGLGRLVYLQYFSSVEVSSVFGGRKREFAFSNNFKGDSQVTKASESDTQGSTLRFTGFTGARLKSYEDVKPGALKTKLLEHFLPYLHERKRAGDNFKITIKVETESDNREKGFFPDIQYLTPADIPQFEQRVIQDITIHAFETITMSYMLRQGMGENQQITAVCVDGRTIPVKLLPPNAIPLNHSAIFFFESGLFTGKSDSARQRVVLPDDIDEKVLWRLLRREVSAVLSERFPEIEQRNSATRKRFEDRYPHLAGLFDEETVGIIDRDEAIEIAQARFFKKQKEVLESEHLDDATYQKSIEVSSRTLTEYVLYRELIISRLREITEKDKEDSIHNLIVPRYQKFEGEKVVDGIYTNNAWLLDDKFMTFRTILSEARMQQVISSITLSEELVEDDGRPDISMIFSADPNGAEKVDVVVIEIKRRIADDKEGLYAVTQLVKRARKLIDHCPNIQRVWYFGIIEIDSNLSQILGDMGWTPLFSKGKVFYRDFDLKNAEGLPVPTPTTLISFDAVIEDAAARNHTFLEILKNEIKKQAV